MEDVGLKSHQSVCCDQRFVVHSLKVFAEFAVRSLKVYAEFVVHGSGVFCWSYCPQLRVYAGVLLLTAQLTKAPFFSPPEQLF